MDKKNRRSTYCPGCNKGQWNMATKIVTGHAIAAIIMSGVFGVTAYASSDKHAIHESRISVLETHIQYQNAKLDELIVEAKKRNKLLRSLIHPSQVIETLNSAPNIKG